VYVYTSGAHGTGPRNGVITVGSKLLHGNLGTTFDYPKADEGVRGMAFIDAVVASGQSDAKWTEFVV